MVFVCSSVRSLLFISTNDIEAVAVTLPYGTVIRIIYKNTALSAGGLCARSGLNDWLAIAAVDGRAVLLRTLKESVLCRGNGIACGNA